MQQNDEDGQTMGNLLRILQPNPKQQNKRVWAERFDEFYYFRS